MTNQKPAQATAANKIIQKSRNLYNSTIKTPVKQGVMMARRAGRSMDIARGNNISKFVPQPNQNNADKSSDTRPTSHPLAHRVHNIRAAQQQIKSAPAPTSKQVKELAIAEAINQMDIEPKKPSFFRKHLKFINISSIILLVIIISGTIVYFNMPSISVAIVSMQSGIKATSPEYHPDGYSINGPASYSDGSVAINFRANTGDTGFIIKQTKSTWDSSAVRNKVNKDSNGEFITTEEKGLTIYTYNGNAAWVNGGILYTIEGNAPLSGDQIRRIATSL